ncbi:MAG: galactitol-1-phosphate 5-dehydrogenase [Ruminococcus sp.]|nr:galactitol-1-phosphate 5-dehydrogenase [Ruminococcus sp.]
MKAAVLHANKDIRFDEIPTPVAEKGTVLVKVVATGICGSDLPRVHDHAAHNYPIILGHEFSGYVAEVGEGVTSVSKDDHVVGIPLVPCMECEDCKNGNYSLCKHYSFVGSRQNGSMAEYVLLPESNVMKIDKSIPFEVAAFFEPSTVAIHALYQADYKDGGTVAVLGGGNIGLFTLQWIKIFGAKKVVVIDVDHDRLKDSLNLGADAVVALCDEDYKDQLNKLTDNRGFDYVFVSTGSTDAMKLAFEIAGNKAHLCFIGTPTKEMTFSVKEWENMNRKEFYLTGSWMSYSKPFPGKEWEMTDKHFAIGDLKVTDSMIFEQYPLDKTMEAFNLFTIPGKVKGKVQIIDK